jgi:hypothetical protein
MLHPNSGGRGGCNHSAVPYTLNSFFYGGPTLTMASHIQALPEKVPQIRWCVIASVSPMFTD